MRRKIIVVNTGRALREPENPDEAEKRIKTLKLELSRLEVELRSGSTESGMRCTLKNEIKNKLRQKNAELRYLKSWLKLNGVTQRTISRVSGETALKMLWRCNQLFRRLNDEGVDFTSEEQQFLTEVEALIEFNENDLLEEARACMWDKPENVFQFGSMIYQATGDERDLNVLMKEWGKLNIKPRKHPKLIMQCCKEYICALGHAGLIEEATDVARSVNQNHPEAAYAWAELASYNDDPRILERARSLGRAVPAGRREYLFLKLYSISGAEEDMALALPDPETERIMGKRIRWFKILIVKEYAHHGDLKRARALLRDFIDPEDRMHALTFLAGFGKDADAVHELLSMIVRHTPAKIETVKRVAAVLAQNSHGDAMRGMLNRSLTWTFCCAGYSVLARFADDKGALEQAEQLLTDAKLYGTTEEAHALYSLAHAQALYGLRANAINTARLIRERNVRCMTLLFLNALSQGDPVPGFIEEYL